MSSRETKGGAAREPHAAGGMKVTSKRPAPVQRMVSSAQELLDYAPMLLRIASDEDYQRGLALYDEVLDQLPDDEGGDDEPQEDVEPLLVAPHVLHVLVPCPLKLRAL